MIIDITGTVLTPGNLGKDCLGNGMHDGFECCCDGCAYMMCCLKTHQKTECLNCNDEDCPHAPANQSDK